MSRRAAGRYLGARVPYGCEVIIGADGNKYLAAFEPEAAILRDLAVRVIDGASMRAVTRWMNAQGHRTRAGNEWVRSSMRNTLISEATATHILDARTARKVREALTPSPRAKSKGGRPITRMLTKGPAKCGSCGRNMTPSSGRYVCIAYVTYGICSGPATVKADNLDAFAEKEFLAVMGNERMTRTVRADDPIDDELDAVSDEVAAVASAFATANPADIADLASRMTALRAREAELKALPRADALAVVESLDETWGDAWNAPGVDANDRRQILLDTGFTVVVRHTTMGNRDVASRSRVEWR